MLKSYQPLSFNTTLQSQQVFEKNQPALTSNKWSKYFTDKPALSSNEWSKYFTDEPAQQQNNNGLYEYLIDNIHNITNFSYKDYFLTNIQNINIEKIESHISSLLFLSNYDKIQKQLKTIYSDYKSYINLHKSIITREELVNYNFKVFTNIQNLYLEKSKMPFIFYKICAKIYAENKIIIIMSTILLFYILLGKFNKKYKNIIKNYNVFTSITKYFSLLKSQFLNLQNKHCVLLLINIIKNIISGKYKKNNIDTIKKNIKNQITYIKNKYSINNSDFLTNNTRKEKSICKNYPNCLDSILYFIKKPYYDKYPFISKKWDFLETTKNKLNK